MHPNNGFEGSQITVEFPQALMMVIEATETGDLTFLISEAARPLVQQALETGFGIVVTMPVSRRALTA